MKNICYIVGAGDFCSRELRPLAGDLVIAADGGHQALSSHDLRPDIVVGDMDSSTQPVVGVPVLRFPVRKNDTDLSLALKLGSGIGYRRFRLYGAAGGPREDHFISALQLMGGWSGRGAEIRLIDKRFTVHALTDASLLIATRPGQTISVFSHSAQSLGVSLRGLSYEGDSLRLSHDFPLGVSNAAVSTRALIGVRQGTLLIYQGQQPYSRPFPPAI